MKVVFKWFQFEVVAIFPELPYSNYSDLMTCYARIGQHSGCSKELLNFPNVEPDEYESLLNELIQIGYNNLEIVNVQY